MARGLRNNNPGNIRHNSDKFQGEIFPSKDNAFKQFESMAYGYRTMFVILATYLTKYKRNTIEKIIQAWAPPIENDTQSYINMVVRFSCVDQNEILTLQNGEKYINIVAAMSRVENGVYPEMKDVIEGFNLQTKITR